MAVHTDCYVLPPSSYVLFSATLDLRATL